MTLTGDEEEDRYQRAFGRYDDARSILYLAHLLTTAEAYQARYCDHPVPLGPDGKPDPWITLMHEDNDRDIRDLRRRLAELSAEPR